MSVHLTFYPFLTLSSEGDSVEFEDSFRQENFPEKAKAAACKTQAEVLEFLKSIKSEGNADGFVDGVWRSGHRVVSVHRMG